jgi:hypothetical protein
MNQKNIGKTIFIKNNDALSFYLYHYIIHPPVAKEALYVKRTYNIFYKIDI